jgi:hypothetical protein
MLYTVYYKRPLWPFWKKIKNVKGDNILFRDSIQDPHALPIRVITCRDETRYELPLNSLIIKFGKDRSYQILEKMKKESGQSIQANLGQGE